MTEFTKKNQKKTFEKTIQANKDDEIRIEFKPEEAVVLSPALGMPAVVKKEDDGTCMLEIILLSKTDNLQTGNVAFHLRISSWKTKDDPNSFCSNNKIFENYWNDKNTVNISTPVQANVDNFGNGLTGPDRKDPNFKTKLAHLNVFPWILDTLSDYKYVYKVSINLKGFTIGMYNIWWVNKKDYLALKNKPKWWNLVQHAKDLVSQDYKKELKEYGGDVDDKENIKASIYHPVYITTKKELNIGHLTDVHLDSRMDMYQQCVASVIEVQENCKESASGKAEIKFDSSGKRIVQDSTFYRPIKDLLVNFNEMFSNLCTKLFKNGADVLVLTGDLIDYGRSTNNEQTYRNKPEKPSVAWEVFNREYFHHALNKDKDNNDRNWFLFYKRLLELYDNQQKPVFTMLGNHDYVNFGMCPWPLKGILWDGVYDQNLTRYESALMFGPGYNNSKEFIADLKEHTDFVKWYTYFINPFPDYVVDYCDQSMFMVDWATNSSVFGAAAEGSGGLHHAKNLFRENSDFDMKSKNYKSETAFSKHPFEIKNYTIYKSWIKSNPETKMLFMHATAICPRDDISIGEINMSYKWTDDKLRYGTFNSRREEVIRDVEKGDLNIIVSGHSHRNLVMEVKENYNDYAFTLAKEEDVNTGYMEPKNLVMVTSSGGPLPKYLPGAPYICACDGSAGKPNKYKTGFFRETVIKWISYKLYQYEEKINLPVITNQESQVRKNCLKGYIANGKCPDCKMEAKDMIKKPPRRHRPGGNILFFEKGKVKITSVFTSDDQSKPRKGPVCEKQGVFVDDMVLGDIENEEKFTKLKDYNSINIISREPFTYYGHMEFPDSVRYVTFLEGKLEGTNQVKLEQTDKQFKKLVKQDIVKDSFEDLKKSATNDESLAFVQYSFDGTEFWDREITITKHFWAKRKDEAQKAKTAIINTAEYFSSYDPQYEKAHFDEFEGMIIQFRTIPDFDKRKDTNVCGY